MSESPHSIEIPDYELLVPVGSGSYGEVWLARGITGLLRAIKIVRRDRFTESEPYEREFNGLREFARISPVAPNQLAVFHIGRNDEAGFFYYVMELADDEVSGARIDPATYRPRTLKAARQRDRRMPVTQVIGLGADLARALAGLHSRGLVHCDIKPSNVIFVGGAPKLADIGLVSALNAAPAFVGTEGFVAPEGPGTPGADIYSLGKLLYEAATGLDRREYPRLPPSFAEPATRDLLLELNEIIVHACEPDPARRYSDAAALLSDLERLRREDSRRLRLPWQARPLKIATVGAAILALAGAGVGARQVVRMVAANRERAAAAYEAEAARSEYVAGLARAQRALDASNLGAARDRLNELVPAAGRPESRGVEWRFLSGEARGDPAVVVQEAGPSVDRLFIAPFGRYLVYHGADLRMGAYDLRDRRLRESRENVAAIQFALRDGMGVSFTENRNTTLNLHFERGMTGSTSRVAPEIGRRVAVDYAAGTLWYADDEQGPALVAQAARVREVWRIPLTVAGKRPDAWIHPQTTIFDLPRTAVAMRTGDGTGARWHLATVDLRLRKIARLEALDSEPTAVEVSPNGVFVAVAYHNGRIDLRTFATGRMRWRHALATGRPTRMAFSSDSADLAVASGDHPVSLLSVQDGCLQRTVRGHAGAVTQLSWSNVSRTLAAGTASGDIRVWENISPARLDATVVAGAGRDRRELVLSHDGSLVAVPSGSATVSILSSQDMTVSTILSGSTAPLGFADGGRSLFTVAPDGQVRRWKLGDVEPAYEEFAEAGLPPAAAATLSANGRWLAVVNEAGDVQVWEWNRGRLAHRWTTYSRPFASIAFSADCHRLAGIGREGGVQLWNAASGETEGSMESSPSAARIAVSRHGMMAVAGEEEDTLDIGSASPRLRRPLRTRLARVDAAAFSPDGSRLVAGGPGGALQVFSVGDGLQETITLFAGEASNGADLLNIQFSANGRRMAALFSNGAIRIWRD